MDDHLDEMVHHAALDKSEQALTLYAWLLAEARWRAEENRAGLRDLSAGRISVRGDLTTMFPWELGEPE